MSWIIMYIDENGNEAIFRDPKRGTYVYYGYYKQVKRRAEECKKEYGWQTYIIMEEEDALDLLFDTCHTCEVDVVRTTIDAIHMMEKMGLAGKV